MEAAAAPAGTLPPPRRSLLSVDVGWVGWLLVALAAGAGGGLLMITHEQLTAALVIAAVGAVLVWRWPLALLVVLLVLASRPSPIRDLTWYLTVTGGAAVLLWRLHRVPGGRTFVWPLALFLVLQLPLLNWTVPLIAQLPRAVYQLPVVHYGYLRLPQEEATTWLRLSLVLIASVIAAFSARRIGKVRLLVAATLIGGAWPVWRGIQQLVGKDFVAKNGFASVQGTFAFPNEFGIFLVLFLLVALVALIEFRHTLARIAIAALMVGGLLDLLHTYTRAAWIAFAAGLLVLAIVRYRRMLLLAVVVLAVSSFSFPGAVDSVQARFSDLANQNAANAKNSLTWRRGQWKAMSRFGSEKPLLGQGFGSYRKLTLEEFGLQARTYGTFGVNPSNNQVTIGFTAHNDFVKSWVESGALGVLLWVLVLLGLAYSLARALRVPETAPWAAALLSAQVGFVLMSLSDNVQAYTVPLLCLCVLSAATSATANALRSSSASRAIS